MRKRMTASAKARDAVADACMKRIEPIRLSRQFQKAVDERLLSLEDAPVIAELSPAGRAELFLTIQHLKSRTKGRAIIRPFVQQLLHDGRFEKLDPQDLVRDAVRDAAKQLRKTEDAVQKLLLAGP